MDLTTALLHASDPARPQPKPLPEPTRSGPSFADFARANRRAEARDHAADRARDAAGESARDLARANSDRANSNRAERSDQVRRDTERADNRADSRTNRGREAQNGVTADETGDRPRFGYGTEDDRTPRSRENRLEKLPLDAAFIEAVRKVVGEALQEATGKSSLFGGSEDGELFSEVTDLGKIASEALLLALAPTEAELGDAADEGGQLVDELLAEGEALLGTGELVPQIAGSAGMDGETAKPLPGSQAGTATHIVSLPDSGETLARSPDGADTVRADTGQATQPAQGAVAAQPGAEVKQPAQVASADVAPVEAPREAREGEQRAQLAGPRLDSGGSDLSRMQRVTGPAALSQHHNGILVADTGHRNYEIRFAAGDLGQIRVELQMEGQKPEASILFNNADAEKPLRDQFATLQTRLASLGIENLVLRQDTAGGWGNNSAPGFGDRQAPQGGTGDAAMPALETEYYLMVPELTADGRLDIRF